jgi:hypothetical protein
MSKRFITSVLILAYVSFVVSQSYACVDDVPLALIASEYYQDVCVGCSVHFDGIGSSAEQTGSYDPDNGSPYGGGNGIDKYYWNFGEPNDPNWYGEAGDPNHTYDTAGIYTVALKVVDDDNTPSDYNDYCEVWVYKIDKVVKEGTTDEGPIYVCLNDTVDLEAIPYPNTVYCPNDQIVWEVNQPADANAVLDPNSGSLTTTLSGLAEPGEYRVDAKCGTVDTGDEITIYVVDVNITSPTSANNKEDFDDQHPGVCSFTATGTTGVSALDADLEWTLTPIAGSTLTTDPSPAKGPTVTFTYTDLPSLNSEFREKTLTLTHPDLPSECNTATQPIEIYYSFDAKNWPGADPNGGDIPEGYNWETHPCVTPPYRYEKTNWYYYYKQTSAHVGAEFTVNQSCASVESPFSYYVGSLENPRYNHLEGVNGGATLWGIDCFAWASRHEKEHSDDFSTWWPDGYEFGPGTDDEDGDKLPDSNEPTWPASEGGPYDPNEDTTNKIHWWNPPSDANMLDCEWECIHTQDYWDVGSLLDEDWAHSGSRWH